MSQPSPCPHARWWKFDFHACTPSSQNAAVGQAAIGALNELHRDILVVAQPGRELARRIQRDVITRGVFTLVKDLDKKLMRCIRQ